MKTVDKIYVREILVVCPYCHEDLDGWYGDPTGETIECDLCGNTFKISDDSEIVLDL